MASQIAQIADAVKTALNAASLSEDFTAERVYVPLSKLEDVGEGVRVLVVPAERAISKNGRESLQSDVRIDIGIVKRLEPTTNPEAEAGNTELDGLMQLAEEIAELFGRGEYGPGKWLNTEVLGPLFDTDRLRESRTFMTAVQLTFKLY